MYLVLSLMATLVEIISTGLLFGTAWYHLASSPAPQLSYVAVGFFL